MVRNILDAASDLAIAIAVAAGLFFIFNPDAYGVWKAKVEFEYLLEAARLGMWDE